MKVPSQHRGWVLIALLVPLGLLISTGACTPSHKESEQPVDEPSLPVDPSDASAPAHESDPELPCDAPQTPIEIPEGALWFQVTLDGERLSGIRVQQGGEPHFVLTDCQGNAVVETQQRHRSLGPTIVASHPEARIRAYEFESAPSGQGPFKIELTRFSPSDNQRYTFQHPGTPDDRANTSRCGHCHEDINDAWYASSHRKSASNPRVLEHYQGTNLLLSNREDCESAGGRWERGKTPGSDEIREQCFITQGAFQTANPQCDNPLDCDESSSFGGCADCHAPGLNGALGGRDLLEARDIAYEFGVHCDVCHRVESVKDLDTEPGVSERLSLLRPSERSPSQALGTWFPLTFGPRHDVPNPRMGSVQRDHYQNGALCSGCHELEQAALAPNDSVDTHRWPDGKFPVQSTFSEWQRSSFADKVACNACHMPPNPKRANSSHLESQPINTEGIAAGFIRPTGSVRHHSWVGPRTEGGRMLQLAATVQLSATQTESAWEVRATTRNVGPGHAIPTGEPSRHLLLKLDATCGASELRPIGGDTIPDYGGYMTHASQLSEFPELTVYPVGTRVRAIERGHPRDYDGITPFDIGGRFDVPDKGLYQDQFIGESVLVIDEDGERRWSPALKSASHYFIVEPDSETELAGHPGFGFARVMVASDGERFVPHYRAVDVASDNRLRPQTSWQSRHLFDANCDNPRFEAVLLYRNSPARWQHLYGWSFDETVMVQTHWTKP